jgi:hypothetical protein
MNPFAIVRDALAAVHPAAPWVTITLSLFVVQWLVRRYLPSLWAVCFGWLPADFDKRVTRAIKALPSVAIGAALPALASGGDVRAAVLGALFGALAPVTHHTLKALPRVPYRGALGAARKRGTP